MSCELAYTSESLCSFHECLILQLRPITGTDICGKNVQSNLQERLTVVRKGRPLVPQNCKTLVSPPTVPHLPLPRVCPLEVSLSRSASGLRGRCSAADPLLWPPHEEGRQEEREGSHQFPRLLMLWMKLKPVSDTFLLMLLDIWVSATCSCAPIISAFILKSRIKFAG